MKTVYKYSIPLQDGFEYTWPEDAEVIHVGIQNDYPYMWVLLTPDSEETMKRTFIVKGTGFPIPDDSWHVGSFLMSQANLVFHVFELCNDEWKIPHENNQG